MATQLPIQDATLWRTILGACRTAGDTQRAKSIAERLVALNPADAATYVLLANSYAHIGEFEESEKVRQLMRHRNVKKTPGITWVTIGGETYTFVASDKDHPLIHLCLEQLFKLKSQMTKEGYIPQAKWVLKGGTLEEKQEMLSYHR